MQSKYITLTTLSATALAILLPEVAQATPQKSHSSTPSVVITIDDFGRPSLNQKSIREIIKNSDHLDDIYAQTNVICKITNTCKPA